MGIILSRFRKSKTTVEILEDIDKQILNLEKFRRSNEVLRVTVAFNVMFYSVISYIITLIGLYLYPPPDDILFQVFTWTLVIAFPVLIYLTKKGCHWWFVRKTRQNEQQLKDFRDQRKEILENVMETETYKKAKEILEKFDPETKRKIEEEKKKIETAANISMASPMGPVAPGTELRRRTNANPSGDNTPAKQQQRARFPLATPQGAPIQVAAGASVRKQPPLPRPILRQNRSTVDKLMEFLVGDGPNNRYALICANCYAHNGMALSEEFVYIDFVCAYCRFFNKARKQKPGAPMLPMFTTPTSAMAASRLPNTSSSIVTSQASSVEGEPKQQQGTGDGVNGDVSNAMTSSAVDDGETSTTAADDQQQTDDVNGSLNLKEETNNSETEEEIAEETNEDQEPQQQEVEETAETSHDVIVAST